MEAPRPEVAVAEGEVAEGAWGGVADAAWWSSDITEAAAAAGEGPSSKPWDDGEMPEGAAVAGGCIEKSEAADSISGGEVSLICEGCAAKPPWTMPSEGSDR